MVKNNKKFIAGALLGILFAGVGAFLLPRTNYFKQKFLPKTELAIIVDSNYESPLPNAKVTIQGKEAYSDIAGFAKFHELYQGYYLLHVKAVGYFQHEERIEVPHGLRIYHVKLTLDERYTRDIPGVVTNAIDGMPIDNAYVQGSGGGKTTTDNLGNFRLGIKTTEQLDYLVVKSGFNELRGTIAVDEIGNQQWQLSLVPLITEISATQKKYTNSTYEISFTFPSDWREGVGTRYSQFGDLIALERRGQNNTPNSELNDGINFSVGYPISLEITFEKYLKKLLDDAEYLYGERPAVQDVQLSGYQAKYINSCIDNGSCSEHYYVMRDGKLIIIGAGYAGSDKDKDAKSFREIVNSIKL